MNTESIRLCEHGNPWNDHCEDCYLAEEIDRQKQKAKKFIEANVWDGENRYGAKNDRATFTPDDLQELIFQLIDDLNT